MAEFVVGDVNSEDKATVATPPPLASFGTHGFRGTYFALRSVFATRVTARLAWLQWLETSYDSFATSQSVTTSIGKNDLQGERLALDSKSSDRRGCGRRLVAGSRGDTIVISGFEHKQKMENGEV